MPSTYSGLPTPMQLLQFAREDIGSKMGWFWFATPNQLIGIGAPAAAPQLVMDASADFLALELMGWADQDDLFDSAAAAVAGNRYTIEISNTSSDRNYQSNPLINTLVCGTAKLPHHLAVPILFQHGSAINLVLTALNPLVAYNIRIAFGGVKIYR